ncbi:MAG: transketolase family protein [Gemmataceae bacterium]
MRAAFASTLTELAKRDPRIVLLTGDLGYMALEPFAQAHPKRFINVGVAEQNMVGLATGLAEAGMLPFVYSIATFASLRPYEFIRNGPVLHGLPVRIIGVGGGFEYGHAGPTHHALEDVGVMRTLPGLTVVAPADHRQARTALQSTWDMPGPVYYRLGKDDRTVVPGLDGRFSCDGLEIVRAGHDVLLLAMGSIATEAVAAAQFLAERGVFAAVAIMACIHPAPTAALANLAARYRVVTTVEAHSLSGGLGSLCAEVIAERDLDCRLVRCGVRTAPDGRSGSQDYYHQRHGLDAASIAESASRALHEVPGRTVRKAG